MSNIADVNTSKGLLHINKLRELNLKYSKSGITYVNKRIYRILYCHDVYICAYEKIKSNKGAVTHSSDNSSLDGMSMNRIDSLIDMIKTEKWQPRPARRVYIPKGNGKLRPLGIQGPEEKLIQEIIRMILEAIYEPYFLDCSHGFRQNKSCLTAMDYVRKHFDGVSYIIEGDISKCYDSINHDKLVSLISQRVEDQKFINLIYKLIKSGYCEYKEDNNAQLLFPKLGTPQGSVLSPLLANIYLHELDMFMLKWIEQHNSNIKSRRNPIKAPLNSKIRNLEKELSLYPESIKRNKLISQIKELKLKLTNIPYIKEGLKIYYVRYADDWIIGINGPITTAKNIKTKINNLLKDKLDLTLNLEKTKISDMRSNEKVLFLGYEIKRQHRGRIIKMKIKNKPTFYKGTTGHKIKLKIPCYKLVNKLYTKGFCDHMGFPLAYKKWSIYEDHTIVTLFNTVRSGLLNFYCLADNSNSFFRIDYILRYSLAKTLAHRHKSSINKIFKKHGKSITVTYINSKGKEVKNSMPKFVNFKPQLKSTPIRDPLEVHIGRLSRSKLGKNCCICGSINKVEMHHLKHIRKRKNNKSKYNFTTFMGLINRKQIPVCHDCHMKIHKGSYDGIKLTQLVDPSLAKQ